MINYLFHFLSLTLVLTPHKHPERNYAISDKSSTITVRTSNVEQQREEEEETLICESPPGTAVAEAAS